MESGVKMNVARTTSTPGYSVEINRPFVVDSTVHKLLTLVTSSRTIYQRMFSPINSSHALLRMIPGFLLRLMKKDPKESAFVITSAEGNHLITCEPIVNKDFTVNFTGADGLNFSSRTFHIVGGSQIREYPFIWSYFYNIQDRAGVF